MAVALTVDPMTPRVSAVGLAQGLNQPLRFAMSALQVRCSRLGRPRLRGCCNAGPAALEVPAPATA